MDGNRIVQYAAETRRTRGRQYAGVRWANAIRSAGRVKGREFAVQMRSALALQGQLLL